MKVLLADDSQLILDRLQDMIHDCKGAEIVASLKNGKDALDSIKRLNPDLVILDINMPGMTGFQVVEAIKKENHNHHTKFIVLTLFASGYFRKKAISLGVDYFFSKLDEFEKVSLVVIDLLNEEGEKQEN